MGTSRSWLTRPNCIWICIFLLKTGVLDANFLLDEIAATQIHWHIRIIWRVFHFFSYSSKHTLVCFGCLMCENARQTSNSSKLFKTLKKSQKHMYKITSFHCLGSTSCYRHKCYEWFHTYAYQHYQLNNQTQLYLRHLGEVDHYDMHPSSELYCCNSLHPPAIWKESRN